MAQPVDPSGLSRMLSDAMSALGQFQSGAAEQDTPPPEGEGSALDGMIRVRTAPPGQVSELVLDPRLLRMPSETLAEELTAAVNAALADLREKTVATTGAVDFTGLNDKLKQIQQDSERQLAKVTNALVEAQERIASQGGR